tara:strand:+ start:699 stop:1022 length:324 start_codon:yes stop_codon:yes gene_type:complete
VANHSQKPTPEAKALSLFLMAYKSYDNKYKEMLKRINKRWDMVRSEDLDKEIYLKEVQGMLDENGGYEEVIEKTVRFYIKKSGDWTLKGEDKYCKDAQAIADKVQKK